MQRCHYGGWVGALPAQGLLGVEWMRVVVVVVMAGWYTDLMRLLGGIPGIRGVGGY